MIQPEKYKLENLAKEIWNSRENWKCMLVDFKLSVYLFIFQAFIVGLLCA